LIETKNSKLPGGDIAGEEFWEEWWKRTRLPLPPALDPHRPGLKNYEVRRFHQAFQQLFKGYDASSTELVEIGCAQSVYLPYFAKNFGFKVAGIDRSETGCGRARKILEREGVKGEIYSADFFAVPPELIGRFDVVISFGVIEHFKQTAEALRAMAKLLKPGGRMFDDIPNLTGVLGRYQKLLDRVIYDAHVPMSREKLASAHQEAGLEIESCDYFMPICLEVINVERWPRNLLYWFTIRSHTAISRAVWFVDDHVVRLPQNRWTSPFICCVSRKPLNHV
jgi:2-polyprenyl-3-methyl-5-hydroxy-6-metoxy-1,4-benzoquinol methylase